MTMAKYQHWYIRGWVYEDTLDSSGVVRRELKYRGEYYRPSCSQIRFFHYKILFSVLFAVICLIYVMYSIRGSSGGRTVYAGAGCILAIVPLIFLGMGTLSLWSAAYKMPFRNYYAGVLRTKVASAVTAALLGFSAVGQAVFMVIHKNEAELNWWDEWFWLGGCFVCAAMSMGIFSTLCRIHFEILSGQIDTSRLGRGGNKAQYSILDE